MEARKLPVYILAHCSGASRGYLIESVKQCISTLIDNLYNDPTACEVVYLSLITFSDTAIQVVPLTSIYDFEVPELKAKGRTAFGSAIELLMRCIKKR